MTTRNFPLSIIAHSPDSALVDGLWALKTSGVVCHSRNGRALVYPGPVITSYPRPDHRVMFSPLRDANPFFHFFEGLWMLAGSNGAAEVAVFAAQMESFADDGLLWGAYGFRWRHYFAVDQLRELISQISKDPSTRRAVLTMWAPNGDLVMGAGRGGPASKDVPCNTHVYFDATGGALDMTVCNRSNDAVWGAYGANVVHMSMLHEFMSSACGLNMGVYHQFSNNFHVYPDRPDVQRLIDASHVARDQWGVKFYPDNRYMGDTVDSYPMVSGYWGEWLQNCEAFVKDPFNTDRVFKDPFFDCVARPLMMAHQAFKSDNFEGALSWASQCAAPDWRAAACEWLGRRVAKRQDAARKLLEGGAV